MPHEWRKVKRGQATHAKTGRPYKAYWICVQCGMFWHYENEPHPDTVSVVMVRGQPTNLTCDELIVMGVMES